MIMFTDHWSKIHVKYLNPIQTSDFTNTITWLEKLHVLFDHVSLPDFTFLTESPAPHEPHEPHGPHESHVPHDPHDTHEPHEPHEPHETHEPHDTHEPHEPHGVLDPVPLIWVETKRFRWIFHPVSDSRSFSEAKIQTTEEVSSCSGLLTITWRIMWRITWRTAGTDITAKDRHYNFIKTEGFV